MEAATVGVHQSNTALSGRRFLVGSRQQLLQPVARKVASLTEAFYLEWKIHCRKNESLYKAGLLVRMFSMCENTYCKFRVFILQ